MLRGMVLGVQPLVVAVLRLGTLVVLWLDVVVVGIDLAVLLLSFVVVGRGDCWLVLLGVLFGVCQAKYEFGRVKLWWVGRQVGGLALR